MECECSLRSCHNHYHSLVHETSTARQVQNDPAMNGPHTVVTLHLRRHSLVRERAKVIHKQRREVCKHSA